MKIEEINASTRICGIIGDPVEHSVSPAMHNAAFSHFNLNYIYLPFQVKQENLAGAIEGIRSLNFRGVNVTIPHKSAVIPYLDEIDTLAEGIGAVNTIVNENGILRGYNTDAPGFLHMLLLEGIDPSQKKFAILGAGGSAKAIAFILADKGSQLTILNRHRERAERLADTILNTFRKDVVVRDLTEKNLKITLEESEILINTTSVGMFPHSKESLISPNILRPGLIVVDIIYNPYKTRLLVEAEKRGLKTINGVDMLVAQGAIAFNLWTGKEAPLREMKSAVIRALKAYEN